jgi:hypothetical protein
MKKNKRLSLIVLCIIFLCSNSLVFANDKLSDPSNSNSGLSDTALEFLNAHNVDLDIFKSLSIENANSFRRTYSGGTNPNDYNSAILSLIDQTEAYGFSDLQIQKYVESLVNNPTVVVDTPANSGTSLFAANRPNDDGVGYEVQSKNGYYQATAFAKVPSAYRGTANDTSGYMFWGVAGYSNGMDIGIWYSDGSGGTGWRVFYTKNGTTTELGGVNSNIYAGKVLYFNAWVVDNYYVRIKITDGSDDNWGAPIADYSIYSYDLGITRTNAYWNRQITLCRTGGFTGSAYIRNAEFYDAYIYKTDGTNSRTTSTNCVSTNLGKFGTNNTTAQKVTVLSSSPWYAEKVSINF